MLQGKVILQVLCQPEVRGEKHRKLGKNFLVQWQQYESLSSLYPQDSFIAMHVAKCVCLSLLDPNTNIRYSKVH